MGLKTKETQFSFEDAKSLYNFLASAFDAGPESFEAEFKNLPRRQQDMYNFRDRKKREHRGHPLSQGEVQLLVNEAGYFRIPNFLFVLRGRKHEDRMFECANHFYRYFQVFRCRDTCHVAFNFSPKLRIGVHLLALNADYDISVITFIKEHSVAAAGAVDFRSVVGLADGGWAHLFGVGSYVTHGCGRHSNVTLPSFRIASYTQVFEKRPKDAIPYPRVIRAYYSKQFYRDMDVNPQCELPDCFE